MGFEDNALYQQEARNIIAGQIGYARRCPSILEQGKREQKARKILAVLHEFLSGQDMGGMLCLDLGCSAALMSRVFAQRFSRVVGIDVDEEALGQGQGLDSTRLQLLRGDACQLPLETETFDAVICAQVYEHVRDAAKLVGEIHRVLKPGGVCFLSGPNWLFPWEAHYGLPFLHWIPRAAASCLLRATRRGETYEERPMTYWQLRSILSQFEITDYTVRLIQEPEKYHLADEPWLRFFKRLPEPTLKTMILLAPNYNLILRKKNR